MIQRLEVEADEMASFVHKKANKPWIWIAMDAKTRQVIAFYVGDRSRKSAKQLWAKIPRAYRQHAVFYTDQYAVYEGVIPAAQHRAISSWPAKPIISSVSTTRCGSAFRVWCARPYRFPRSSPIISVPSSISSATII
jgi:IS1 family transposase